MGEHTLVKTHGPRGTVHLLPAADLPMWIGALARCRPAPSPRAYGSTRPDRPVVEAIREVLTGAALTIDELSDAVVAPRDRGRETWSCRPSRPCGRAGGRPWRRAAHRGVFVFGPDRGARSPIPAPRSWRAYRPAGGRRASDALAAYLRAYGPASPGSSPCGSAPRAWAADALRLARPAQSVLFEGVPAWVAAGDTQVPGRRRGRRLLPYFDAYVVAGRPRDLLYPGRPPGGPSPRRPGGQLPGAARRRPGRGRVAPAAVRPPAAVTVDRSRALPPPTEALEAEVARVGQILEGEPR